MLTEFKVEKLGIEWAVVDKKPQNKMESCPRFRMKALIVGL